MLYIVSFAQDHFDSTDVQINEASRLFCPSPVLLSPSVDLENLTREEQNLILETKSKVKDRKLVTKMIPLAGLLRLDYTITNIKKSGPWINLSKDVIVKIKHIKLVDPIKVVTLTTGCGAGAETRKFPPIDLHEDSQPYEALIHADDPTSDYYYLEPGAFEVYTFSFTCSSPGFYEINITSGYAKGSEKNTISLLENYTMVCTRGDSGDWVKNNHSCVAGESRPNREIWSTAICTAQNCSIEPPCKYWK